MKKLIFLILLISIFNQNAFGTVIKNTVVDDKKNPLAVQGEIDMAADFYQALSSLYPNNSVVNNGIKIELWRVTYQDQPLQAGFSQTVGVLLNEKQENVQIGKIQRATSTRSYINYTISNIPEQGNYIVLVYFDKMPSTFSNTRISGFGDDGKGRNDVLYRSDAKIVIGIDKVFSMYSVLKFDTRLPLRSNLDFLVQNNLGVSTNGFFGAIGNFFGDLWDTLKEIVSCSGKVIKGIFTSGGAGTAIIRTFGTTVTLIADQRCPEFRTISETEYNWANEKIFGGTLPPRESITITNLRFSEGRPVVLFRSDGIDMHLGNDYSNPLANAQSRATFIHELTHVWQFANRGRFNYTIEGITNQVTDAFNVDVYEYQCGKNWNDYNYERQADIVRDYYCWREYGLLPTWQYLGNDLYNSTPISSYYSSRYLVNKSSNYLSNDPYRVIISYNNPANYQYYGVTLFKGCLPCQEELVIKNIRFGKRFDIKQTVDAAFSGKNFNLFEGKYPISSPLRISKKMTIGTCSGTAIIGRN